MRRRLSPLRLLGLLAVVAIGVVALVILRPLPPADRPEGAPEDSQVARAQSAPVAPPVALSGWRVCERVIDGDTVVLDGDEHVRLIGVDTPEKNDVRPEVRQLARQATAFTRGLVTGRKVRLEYDQTRRDRYGRTLAYVYLEDGSMLNAEIIRRGYGFAYVRHPFRYLAEFRGYEREARDAGAGLWGTGAGRELETTGRRIGG